MKTYARKISIFLLLLSMISVTFATSYAPSEPKKIYSLNKNYYIDFNPNNHMQKVLKVTNNNQSKTLWSFKYNTEYGDELFVSNDGKHVFVIRSKFVKLEDLHKSAVLIFNPHGIQTHYTYNHLSKPRKYHSREVGPIGDFWRVWRTNKITITSDSMLHINVEGHSRDRSFNLN